MNKRMNIIFFGICFLASLIGEAYCLLILNGDTLSTVGIGMVVLITGYLLMDSIKNLIKSKNEKIMFYLDRILTEETEKWNERFTELTNIQKATYTATKKNNAMLSEKLSEVVLILDSMENNYTKETQRMIELQKRSMEGQKNSLNMELHYNKENTKQIINALHEEGTKMDLGEQLSRIINLLETNNELLKSRKDYIDNSDYDLRSVKADEQEYEQEESDFNYEDALTEDSYDPLATLQQMDEEEPKEENAPELYETFHEESELEAVKSIEDIKKQLSQNVLSFADIEQLPLEEIAIQHLGLQTSDVAVDQISEAQSFEEADAQPSKSINVTPIYDDPNKALSADEIAALFASIGN
ncbi:MAG: hypothetical protein PHF63_07910 [Herbinix sp.]|nr:hypothetical protein [Herbinix sp.]